MQQVKKNARYRALVSQGLCPRCGQEPEHNDVIYCESCKEAIDIYRRLRLERSKFMKAVRTLASLYTKLPEYELGLLMKEARDDVGLIIKPVKARGRT